MFGVMCLIINRKVAPLLMIQNKNIAREQTIFVKDFVISGPNLM